MTEIFVNDRAKADEDAQNDDLAAVTGFLEKYAGNPHFQAPWFLEAGCDWSKDAVFNARQFIKHKHWFADWEEYVAFHQQLQGNPEVQRFDAAADAVYTGDLETLKQLLSADPGLPRRRSLRGHHATLLNYTGANGVEGWRQKTPGNIVGIAELLLNAGAEVDAWGDMYGGTSTLGLAAAKRPRNFFQIHLTRVQIMRNYMFIPVLVSCILQLDHHSFVRYAQSLLRVVIADAHYPADITDHCFCGNGHSNPVNLQVMNSFDRFQVHFYGRRRLFGESF